MPRPSSGLRALDLEQPPQLLLREGVVCEVQPKRLLNFGQHRFRQHRPEGEGSRRLDPRPTRLTHDLLLDEHYTSAIEITVAGECPGSALDDCLPLSPGAGLLLTDGSRESQLQLLSHGTTSVVRVAVTTSAENRSIHPPVCPRRSPLWQKQRRNTAYLVPSTQCNCNGTNPIVLLL